MIILVISIIYLAVVVIVIFGLINQGTAKKRRQSSKDQPFVLIFKLNCTTTWPSINNVGFKDTHSSNVYKHGHFERFIYPVLFVVQYIL